MAFDAGMLAAVINEIKGFAIGAKVEKVHQPERDEIHLIMHTREGNRRLMINAGSNNPRIGFTETAKENPQKAPMFCMLLRKHFSGAKLSDVCQIGFDRALVLEFDGYDEMGFACKKKLVVELMGKYSNLIFTDGEDKIVSALKLIGISSSEKRQILPGMIYEIPPTQEKIDPLSCDGGEFSRIYNDTDSDVAADRFITSNFLGIAPIVAREISYIATRHTDTPLRYVGADELWGAFSTVMEKIKTNAYLPTVIFDDVGMPIEYSYIDVNQYGAKYKKKHTESFRELFDLFFETRDREQRIRQHASDISRLLSNAESRLKKKLDAQRRELEDHKKGEKYKKQGDLITANIHMLSRGAKCVKLVDYYAEPDENGAFPEYEIILDEKLTPAANAQRMYKLYNKSKNALIEIAEQMRIATEELEYISTVSEALLRAECESDMSEIRDELYRSGYASRMKNYTAGKQSKPNIAKFKTTGGYTVYCGKNNTQNEYVTFKLAEPTDWWFHVKNKPGSHVIMVCGDEEPSEVDFTEAAEIAAYHSSAKVGDNVAVDYTKIRHIKKPRGTKPGYVTYGTNWTAYVTPKEETIKKLRV